MADLKTDAIVLKRVNYREGDRIITFLTPDGRVSAIAKGARKEKSKLAGGIEMFTLSSIVIHQRDGIKSLDESNSEVFGILTSARSKEFYHQIIADFETLELASSFLKQISRLSHQICSADLFDLLKQTFSALNSSRGDSLTRQLIKIYFNLNQARIAGEEINVFFDHEGQKLEAAATYDWDSFEKVLIKKPGNSGSIDQNIIKILRLMLTTQLNVVLKIKNLQTYLPILSYIAA